MGWKTSQVRAEPGGEHLTAGLAHHGDGVSLHHRHVCGADRSHRRSRPPLHKDLNFDLCYSFTVFCLADVNPRVFWMDHGPLRKDGHRCLLQPTEAWDTILHPDSCTFVCFHLDDISTIRLFSNQL